MFLDELGPVWNELTQNPMAFMGGFVSGLLRVNLEQDPVKSWLEQNGITTHANSGKSADDNGSSKGPQSITIE